MNREMLTDMRRYRDQLRKAFRVGREHPGSLISVQQWDLAHVEARRLIEKYGIQVYARMDNIVYRYV